MHEKPTNVTVIQFINYVWYLLHVSALHCHHLEALLVPSERRSVEEQSIEYCGCACCVEWRGGHAHHATRHSGNVMPKHVGAAIHN
jgi:hypothetical protein